MHRAWRHTQDGFSAAPCDRISAGRSFPSLHPLGRRGRGCGAGRTGQRTRASRRGLGAQPPSSRARLRDGRRLPRPARARVAARALQRGPGRVAPPFLGRTAARSPEGGARRAYRAGAVRRRPVEGARSRGTAGKPPKPKARPAKPAGAAKPQRAPKPGGAAKPLEAAKPPGAAKASKPARSAKPKPPSRTKPGAKPQTRRRKRSPSPRANLRPVGEQSRPVATDAPNQKKLTCSIFGWRDGRVADFYAVAFGLQGRDWIVERSPRFFWPAGDMPHEAHEAHAILVDALLRAGWRAVGYEGAWYRQRFERAIETAPE